MNLLKAWRAQDYLLAEEEDLRPSGQDLGPPTLVPIGEILSTPQVEQVSALERAFRDVFSPLPGHTHWAVHQIQTEEGKVVRLPTRRWPRHLEQTLQDEVDAMQWPGVIEASQSPWRSHPVMVPKLDRLVRECINFCKLNEVSQFDAYQCPRFPACWKVRKSTVPVQIRFNEGVLADPSRTLLPGKDGICGPSACSNSTGCPLGYMWSQPHFRG